jgi:hypothetical protein
VLRNPRYAGAFAFGRTRQRQHGEGKRVTVRKAREEWFTLQQGAHEGYVSWDRYEENQKRLAENAQALGVDRRRCSPREGPALLQGLLLCGVCGKGMSVRYYTRGDGLTPHYSCQGRGNKQGERWCQTMAGRGLDAAIAPLIFEALSPMSLEISLAVQQEIEGRLEDADRLRRQQVERARYETDLARSRYMHVDPNNRLVADELEGEWNKKLTALTQAQQEYERRRQQDRLQLNEEARARILSLAADVPKLWADPKTPQRERKQVVRFIIEDATVLKNDAGLTLQIRFKGGATRTLSLPAPKTAWEERQTKAEVMAEIDRLLNDHTFREIAGILNERKLVSGTGRPFHGDRVEYLCRFYKLKPRFDRLRAAGLLTLDELAVKLGRSTGTIKLWRLRGTLPVRAHKLDDNGRHMYEDPGSGGP